MIVITLSNLFTTPLHTGVPFSWKDLTPLARMALDQFVMWVNAESPYKTAKEYLAAVGIMLGTIIGVLPGLGGANGVAILLPVTFTMPPTSGIILLTSIYWGALFGGAITSILFNIPGEPWSVATTAAAIH